MSILFSLATSAVVKSGVMDVLPVFFSGAIFMALIFAIITKQSALLRLNLIVNGVLSIALLSHPSSFVAGILGVSFALHLWLVFSANQWQQTAITALAVLTYIVLFSAHLLMLTPLLWLVTAFLILSLTSFFVHKEEHEQEIEQATPSAPIDHAEPAPLSDLPNRLNLKLAFNQWREQDSSAAVLVLLRLEGFGEVNQHIGRDFGDLLLAQSAVRIKQQLQTDKVLSLNSDNGSHFKLAHLGGLNFAFVCLLDEQLHLHQHLIAQIRQVTLKPFNVANCTIEVKVRASYVDCSDELANFDNIISFAFLALDSNPDQDVVAFEQQMMIEQLEQQARLRELAHLDFPSELELYFQPVIRNQDQQIEFLELLLRWQHPKQGILSANRFIDDIRVAGLAYPLAVFVIERAAELAMALRMEGISIPLSINVFGSEMLNEEFIEFVDSVIQEHRLLPGDLIIECPLDLFMILDDQGKGMIARLNSIGIKVCVDGLGDSPVWLSKLPNINVEYIKVSPSLTTDLGHQGQIRSLISGMVSMHNDKDAKVICEGIETVEQLNFVKKLNAYAAQGYYFSYPLSSVGMLSWLKQWQIEFNNKQQ